MNEFKKYLVWSVVAAILSLGLILSSFIITDGLIKIKGGQNLITVTGSAKKEIKSDLIKWNGMFSAQSVKLADAYNSLKESLVKVKSYLTGKGIEEKDIVVMPIYTTTNYEISPKGMTTNKVESYTLTQMVEIQSGDVDKITDISREATELINEGIEFQSNPPEYYYTKIANLKVDMIALATKDAKNRAEQIANSTGTKIGALRSAKMGVFQITPLYSTMVSDSGIYDTSSLDKEITAVMTCDFEIK